MRFYLWLTTGMITKEWVAIHRKHHGHTERAGDPHSPKIFGLWTVLFGGAWLYAKAAGDHIQVQRWGQHTPNDWIERHLYTPWSNLGIMIMLGVDLALWGLGGLAVWIVQMIWVLYPCVN